MGIAPQGLLSFGARGICRLARFVEKPLTFRLRILRRLGQERRALPVEFLVLVLELVVFLLSFGLLGVGIGEFLCNPLLPCVDGVKDGFVEEMLQEPHQDEEIERLRSDGKPVDQHKLTFQPLLWLGR